MPWTILKRFGYDDNLTLEIPNALKEKSSDDLSAEKGTVTPELSSEAIRFLSGLLESSARLLDIESSGSPISSESIPCLNVSGSVIQVALSVLSASVRCRNCKITCN